MISRDYQDLYLGLFINLGEKSDQSVQITEIKGIFQSLDEKQGNLPSSSSSPPSEEDNNVDNLVDIEGDGDIEIRPLNHHVVWGYAPVLMPPSPSPVHQYPLRVQNITPSNSNWSHAHPYSPTYHPTYNARLSRTCKKKGMLFSFQKQSPEMRLDDLKQFQHYRSFSHTWPVKRSRVKISIKVVGIKCECLTNFVPEVV